MLSRTITSLNEALAHLEANKDALEAEAKLEGPRAPDGLGLLSGLPTPPGSPSLGDADASPESVSFT